MLHTAILLVLILSMNKLSVVIITFNEERNIYRSIASVREIADEIIVLDSFSTDNTVAIAEKSGARVFRQSFSDYVSQKNIAIDKASNDWVLSIDADEMLTPELKMSIREVLEAPANSAYKMARSTNYCGKWVRYCGWYPDWKIRLFDRTKGKWEGEAIHEYWQSHNNETEGTLSGDLLHYSFHNLSDHLRKIDGFTEIQARVLAGKNKKITIPKLLFAPFWRFFSSYFLKLGILDGTTGFTICIMSAYANFMKYAKTRNHYKQQAKAAAGHTLHHLPEWLMEPVMREQDA